MSETVSTEMATLDDLSVVTSEVQLDNVMKSLSGASTTIVSTVQGDDFEARTKVVNAVVNAEPLEDSLGKVIELESRYFVEFGLSGEDVSIKVTQVNRYGKGVQRSGQRLKVVR